LNEKTLNFRNFTVKFGDTGQQITIETYRSKLPKRGETVTGFRFSFFSEVIILTQEDEREFIRWMKREFPSLLRSNLQESIETRFPLEDWFPYMKSYDIKVEVSVDKNNTLTFEIETEITVTFSHEVPYKQFSEGLRRFVSNDFDYVGITSDVSDTIDHIITSELPQKNFLYSIQTSPPSRIQIFWGGGQKEFDFPEYFRIHIYFQEPLPEDVLNLLMNSPDERDFLLKLSLLIKDEDVENIAVISSSQSDEGIRDITDVIKFLREV